MPITMSAENLIGKEICITASPNKSLIGITGTVLDETKFLLTIAIGDKTRTIHKNQVTIKTATATINGKELIGKLEERMKK